MARRAAWISAVASICLLCCAGCVAFPSGNDGEAEQKPYEPAWDSITQHTVPEWFRDAKFGIYAHWGPYSVPAHGTEWYPHYMYNPDSDFYKWHKQHFGDPAEFGYKDFIPMFKAENFDAEQWAELFQKAGAKFAGPVAEHHDGFSMWDSELTAWDAGERGPKRDITGELEKAVKKRGMKFITSFHHARKWWYFEYSYTEDDKYDTENPEYAGIGKIYPPSHEKGAPPTAEYMEEWQAKVREVIDKYQPDLLWFDGGLKRKKFWRSVVDDFEKHKQRFLAYYYNKAAEEWDRDVGVTYKGEDLPDGAGILDIERGRMNKLSEDPWLTDTSVDRKSWCHISNPDYKSVNQLVDVLVDIVSKNGCMLLNIGPRADGTIPQAQKDLLLGIGQWLELNGEAIYGTRPWLVYGEGPSTESDGGEIKERRKEAAYNGRDLRFTTKGGTLYVICLGWPGRELTIESLGTKSPHYSGELPTVSMLGVDGPLKWVRDQDGLTVKMPRRRPCDHAVTLRIPLEE